MPVKFGNNATSTLAASINTAVTSISVQAGDASKFPAPGAGDWFPLTVVDGAGNMEVMRCTARVGATLTVARAQEGTTAKAFPAGARAELRITAAAFADFQTQLDAKANLAGANFTGNVTSTGAVTGNTGLYSMNGDIVVRSTGNKHVWFQTAAGVVRGLVYHDNNGTMNINTYNTAGTYLYNFNVGENGAASWGGHNFRIGGQATTSEYQLWTNDAADSYRMLGDSGGGWYFQHSTDRFVANATNRMWFNSTGGAVFQNHVYAETFQSNSNGTGTGLKLGDDAWIGDVNRGNTMSVRGVTDFNSGYIQFGAGTHRLGTPSGALDRLYYADNWFLQSDGNQWIPYAGLMLHQMFDQKAGVYTGSTRDELNFPLGHPILMQTNNSIDRNVAQTIYLSGTAQYALNVSGSPLTGTWRTRGVFSGQGYLMQRVG